MAAEDSTLSASLGSGTPTHSMVLDLTILGFILLLYLIIISWV